MCTLVVLLSVLLVSLPCAGSLPALCAESGESPSCCQHQTQACDPGQPASYCCPTEAAPTPLPTTEIAIPAPLPAPELAVLSLPGPVFSPRLSAFYPASPPGPHRPALYQLHRAYRI